MKVKTKGNKEEGLRNANLIAWVASQEALDLTSLAGRFFLLSLNRVHVTEDDIVHNVLIC